MFDPESEKEMALWEPRAEDPGSIPLEGVPPPTKQELGFFAWAFAELLTVGGPILPALTTLCGASENPWLRRLASQMWQDVSDGGEISATMQCEPFLSRLDPELALAVESGEESGCLADLLRGYAKEALEGATESLSSVLRRSVELVQFTEHLGTLLREGEPVLPAVEATAARLPPEAAAVANEIAASVEAGDLLFSACARHSCSALLFDPLWLFCLEWGEQFAKIDVTLGHLAKQAFPLKDQD